MRHRALLAAGILLVPAVAWTVSSDFNARMWLSKVTPFPSSPDTAYSQWVDDGEGTLKPGPTFTTVGDGINAVIHDQAQANPAQAQQGQQVASAQQFAQQYNTPEGQAALRNMTPEQLMALSHQMQPQSGPHAVSDADQTHLRKIGDGGYPGHQQVSEDVIAITRDIDKMDADWDKAAKMLDDQEAKEMQQLPRCKDEGGEPSDSSVHELKLRYAEKRISLAGTYLGKVDPLIVKVRTAVTPEIDYGDLALDAWGQIQDPGLKQSVFGPAHSAEQVGLNDVMTVENLVGRFSNKAAQTVAARNAIKKKHVNPKGC